MAKGKKVTVELSEAAAGHIVNALDARLVLLDKLFKTCMVAGQKDAAEEVAVAIKVVRETRGLVVDENSIAVAE